MHVWLILIGGSALTGLLAGRYIHTSYGIYLAGIVPWTLLLLAILYTEYCTPYQGGGASMWPIAQLFGGTIAATTGALSYTLARKFWSPQKNHNDQDKQPV